MTITHGQSLIGNNLLLQLLKWFECTIYNCGNEHNITNNNCWVPESTKSNQHKITTNIGKRNLSGAQ